MKKFKFPFPISLMLSLFLIACNNRPGTNSMASSGNSDKIKDSVLLEDSKRKNLAECDPLKDWKIGASMGMSKGSVIGNDGEGISRVSGYFAFEFKMFNPPEVIFVQDGSKKFFQFKTLLPNGNGPAKIVFTSPHVNDDDAQIPYFTPIIKDNSKIPRVILGEQFRDFPQPCHIEFSMTYNTGTFGGDIKSINWFNDGSEHRIFGIVKLFGLTFKNQDKAIPLLFEIEKNRYIYISGKGSVTTKESKVITFGE
jgi:hypothetical protein